MNITKTFVNNLVNRNLLKQELSDAGFDEVIMRFDNFEVHNVLTESEAIIDVILSAHDSSLFTPEQKVNELVSLAYSDILVYYRTELVNAAGNGAAIAALYAQAMTYQSQNLKLTDTMLSLRTIEEVGSGANIDVNTNAGKARYLSVFLLALTMWAIQ